MTAPGKTPHKRSARDNAYNVLRQQIVASELPPGAALSENELAATLGFSRTPIREALLLLRRDGLVQVFPKVGSFVSRVDPDAVSEAQFLREAVEVASLRSLVPPLVEAQVARLADNLDRQDAAHDTATFFVLDEEFHAALMALAGHERAWDSVVHAKAHLDRARTLGLKLVSSTADLTADHRAVFDAVLANDIPAAEARLRTHLRLVFPDIEAMRHTSPELFDSGSAPVRRSIVMCQDIGGSSASGDR